MYLRGFKEAPLRHQTLRQNIGAEKFLRKNGSLPRSGDTVQNAARRANARRKYQA
jgi:hypothetical protein